VQRIAPSLAFGPGYNPANFLCTTARDFVATRYLSESAASSPPMPSFAPSLISQDAGALP